jgi:hypothetical protein
MDIISYEGLIANMEMVNKLVNKTIECSKDYTDSKKSDVIDQMVSYISNTLSDISMLNNNDRQIVVSYIMKYLKGVFKISSGPFGGNGEGATIQIFFDRFDGDLIRVYSYSSEYWYERKSISDKGLQYLIKYWDETKECINTGIKEGIYMINRGRQEALKKQLELHEAVKNFKV